MLETALAALPANWTWLVGAVFVAGMVRGFAGFGTAMVYLPIASLVLSPKDALVSMAAMDILGPLPVAWRARRDMAKGQLTSLLFGFILTFPIGLYILTQLAPERFQILVASCTLGVLVILVSGWRYRGLLSSKLLVGTGLVSGVWEDLRASQGRLLF
ncbi:MAG: TSUP family transporter [Pseudomonadota bacterium]